jgi:DNA mismatch repair protein MLH1
MLDASSNRALPPATPPVRLIHKLDEITVNRIAAGEIIQRPHAVVKEMLENSLDAGATSIQITIKNGGIDFLQIQDNGHGINKDSLPILCERFTTSKIRSFDDLTSCTTFGFRGEALASISHVAHLTVLTKTPDSPCAYKAKYLDGILVPFHASSTSTSGSNGENNPLPKPCAGLTGTTITVEDLFYNMLPRRQAMKNYSEEAQRVIDVVTRYAVHYGDRMISMTCKKYGMTTNSPDVHTPTPSTTLNNIKLCYGPQIARELLPFTISHGYTASTTSTTPPSDRYEVPLEPITSTTSHPEEDIQISLNSSSGDESKIRFLLDGYVTNANYSCKKSICIIFINNRLVECGTIRRMMENVYTQYLPKHTHPFLYLALRLPYEDVDINVHPTKKEVIFLHEEEILGVIHDSITAMLAGANNSRVFYTQSFMTDQKSSRSQGQQQQESSSVSSHVVTENHTASQRQPQSREKRSRATEEVVELDWDEVEDDGDANRMKKRSMPSSEEREPPEDRSLISDRRQHTRKSVDATKLVRTDASASFIHQYFPSKASPSPGPPLAKKSSSERPHVVDLELELASEEEGCDEDAIVFAHSSPTQISDSVNEEKTLHAPPLENHPFSSSTRMTSSSSLPTPTPHLPLYCTECNQTNPLPSSSIPLQGQASYPRPSSSMCLCCQQRKVTDADFSSSSLGDVSTQPTPTTSIKRKFPPLRRTQCSYVSVKSLIQQIENNESLEMKLLLKKYVFVGIVNSAFMLIQYETKLYLLDYSYLLLHLFYQLTLLQFQSHSTLSLANNPIPLMEYILFALSLPITDWKEEDGPKQVLADAMTNLLISKRDLLQKYFSLHITSEGTLIAIPDLLEDYRPLPQALPLFLLRLASEPNWDEEEACFDQIAKEIALFFSCLQPQDAMVESSFSSSPRPNPSASAGAESGGASYLSKEAENLLTSLLLPAMKYYLIPSQELQDNGTVVAIADLKNLYKIFERC